MVEMTVQKQDKKLAYTMDKQWVEMKELQALMMVLRKVPNQVEQRVLTLELKWENWKVDMLVALMVDWMVKMKDKLTVHLKVQKKVEMMVQKSDARKVAMKELMLDKIRVDKMVPWLVELKVESLDTQQVQMKGRMMVW